MNLGRILHIVDPSSTGRAQQARVAYAIGWHAEVYSTPAELLARLPSDGVLMVRDQEDEGALGAMLEAVAQSGVWLPIVGTSESPLPGRVVSAIKSGAMDYLALPLDEERLQQSLRLIAQEAAAFGEAWRRVAASRARIAGLTAREREVLDWLAQGFSNKGIARELGISPRTVEIHRANMMTKIGADNTADAVRLRMEAQLGAPQERAAPELPPTAEPGARVERATSERVRELRRRLAEEDQDRQRTRPAPSTS